MSLFAHIVSALQENKDMNQLDHWFEGFTSGDEAIDIYGQDIDCTDEEMAAVVTALNEMAAAQVSDIEEPAAQAAIEKCNLAVWGVDFGHNGHSVPG